LHRENSASHVFIFKILCFYLGKVPLKYLSVYIEMLCRISFSQEVEFLRYSKIDQYLDKRLVRQYGRHNV
jgi:hypothetical protein